MKIFDRTEIAALFVDPSNASNIMYSLGNYGPFIQAALAVHADITVNEVRAAIGFGPHPDPAKGASYLWQTETDTPA